MYKYEIILYWSEDDQAYVAEAPLKNSQDAIGLWIDTAKAHGDPVPEPKGRRLIFA
ncbi:MAG: type II toxin-antitoxin system HicB family antitoxin [Nitrospinae bacterium]|nr:type II toxin-antitoxin system HicB family antitoxin [Nitrospinota bacterium]